MSVPSHQASEVIKALTEGTDDDSESRDRERHPWRKTISVELEESMEGGHRARTLMVTTIDLSRNGLGFYADSFVHPGTSVHALFDSLPEQPRLSGTVVYCRYENNGRHRVGVKLIEPEGDTGPSR